MAALSHTKPALAATQSHSCGVCYAIKYAPCTKIHYEAKVGSHAMNPTQANAKSSLAQ
jgi:hypothetical protein